LTFSYDPNGNRIRKAVTQNGQTTTTQYVVDTQQPYAQVVEELDTNGAVTAKYVYGHDLLKSARGGSEYYYFYDGLGSVRLVVGAAGTVQNRYSYEAHGTVLAGAADQEGNTPNEYLFTGERVDADTGLVYLRARYYDPTTGTFKQLDSFLGDHNDPITLHRYTYGANDPTNRDDPSGHFFRVPSLAAVLTIAAIGTVVAAAIYFAVRYQVDKDNLSRVTPLTPAELAVVTQVRQQMRSGGLSELERHLTIVGTKKVNPSESLTSALTVDTMGGPRTWLYPRFFTGDIDDNQLITLIHEALHSYLGPAPTVKGDYENSATPHGRVSKVAKFWGGIIEGDDDRREGYTKVKWPTTRGPLVEYILHGGDWETFKRNCAE